MARLTTRRAAPEDDEGFYVSMSDMLTGLLFMFIILLVYFAVNFRETTEELTGANAARAELLRDLKQKLEQRQIKVEIDTDTGVLRLPDERILFAEADHTLSESGQATVSALADMLIEVLPCYTDQASEATPCRRKPQKFRIDALFVEGHSDARALWRGGRDSNVDLSAKRAISTYLALRERQSLLDALKTNVGTTGRPRLVPILSVSGYGGTRPVPGREGTSAGDYAANRRIDLRFLMATPDVNRFADMLL